MKKLWIKLAITALTINTALTALAVPRSLGREGAWEGVQDTDKNICYMVSFPLRSEGNYTKRDAAYLIVTIRPLDNTIGEVAYYAGYPYGSKATTFAVGGKQHSLIPNGEWAWTKNKDADSALLKDLMGGNRLIVKGYSKKGTQTTDTYSLSGVTSSWRKIKTACGK